MSYPESPTDTQNGTAKMIGTSIKINETSVKSLLCNALEGGSNYWCIIHHYDFTDGIVKEDFREGGKFQEADNYYHPAEIIPLVPGCAVVIEDIEDDGKQYRLDRAAIERAIELMVTKQPRHLADWLSGNDDATTGDVFLQLALFGDVVYG